MLRERLDVISGISIIAFLALLISFLNGTWIDYPKGWDANGHLSRVRFFMESWPHYQWWYIWYAGEPHLRWYCPIAQLILAFPSATLGCSIGFSIILIFLASIISIGVMLYLSAFKLTKDHLASLIAAILTISSSNLWGLGIYGGLYIRVMAASFFSATLFFMLVYFNDMFSGVDPPRRIYLFLSVSFSLCIVTNPIYGIGATVALFFLLILCAEKWTKKISAFIKILLSSALVSAWYIVPFFVPINIPGGGSPITVAGGGIGDYTLSNLLQYLLFGLSPVTVPLVLASTVLMLIKRKQTISTQYVRIIVALWIISIFFLLYPMISNTLWLSFLIIFLPLLCGVLMHHLTNLDSQKVHRAENAMRHRFKAVKVLLLFVILATMFINYPIGSFSLRMTENKSFWGEDVVKTLLNGDINEKNYRFGVPSDEIASWFNYKYDIPQTRGYATPLYPDWSFYPGDVHGDVPRGNHTYSITNFFLDWFAVKWFVVYTSVIPYNYTQFLRAPETYRLVVERNGVYGFIYENASPIASATNAPSLAVIGTKLVYKIIFDDFSFSNYNSHYVVPIQGREYLDDYNLEELREFDSIILYNYKFHDYAAAYKLLGQYVHSGGGLIIDTGVQGSPDYDASSIPLPSPIEKTSWTNFGKEWRFTQTDNIVTQGINFSAFSPAIYYDSPWCFSASKNESVRAWAKPILWNNGYPLVVAGEYGDGRVIWSGMNLLYHIAIYKNPEESKFLANMIDWASKAAEKRDVKVDYVAKRMNPEEVVVALNNLGRGVLFKESFFPNWRAYLVDAEGNRYVLQIWKAGPNFMYVRVPSKVEYPASVVFEYGMTWVESCGTLLSVFTLILLLSYTFVPSIFNRLRYPFTYLRKIVRRLKKWWYQEEWE